MLSLAVFTVSLLVRSLDSSVLPSSANSQLRSLEKITNIDLAVLLTQQYKIPLSTYSETIQGISQVIGAGSVPCKGSTYSGCSGTLSLVPGTKMLLCFIILFRAYIGQLYHDLFGSAYIEKRSDRENLEWTEKKLKHGLMSTLQTRAG